jgi:hypothetical protein
MKEGIYFLKSDPENKKYDEKGNNVFVENIPMLEVKKIFVKQDSKGPDLEQPSSPLVRKLSTLVPFGPSELKGKSAAEEVDSRVTSNRWHGHEFQIETFDEDMTNPATQISGECSGRVYHIRADSKEICMETVAKVEKLARKLRAAAEAKGRFFLAQEKLLKYYKSTPFQTLIAWLILTVKFQM